MDVADNRISVRKRIVRYRHLANTNYSTTSGVHWGRTYKDNLNFENTADKTRRIHRLEYEHLKFLEFSGSVEIENEEKRKN